MDTCLPGRSAPDIYVDLCKNGSCQERNTSSSSLGQSQMRVQLKVLAGAVSFPTRLISITSRQKTSHGLKESGCWVHMTSQVPEGRGEDEEPGSWRVLGQVVSRSPLNQAEQPQSW